jgi:hypothetical protein
MTLQIRADGYDPRAADIINTARAAAHEARQEMNKGHASAFRTDFPATARLVDLLVDDLDDDEMPATTLDVLTDLRDRCQDAVRNLQAIDVGGRSPFERARLNGKIEGVKLALSYLDETIRGLQ